MRAAVSLRDDGDAPAAFKVPILSYLPPHFDFHNNRRLVEQSALNELLAKGSSLDNFHRAVHEKTPSSVFGMRRPNPDGTPHVPPPELSVSRAMGASPGSGLSYQQSYDTFGIGLPFQLRELEALTLTL